MADDLDFGATLRGYSPGQKIFNRYILRKILGRGGMGIVWLAHDEDLERDIALKFLPEVVAADAQSIRDLKRETRRSLELTYPNIIRIYDFVKDTTTAAISMEYVEGKTLAELKLAQETEHFEVADIENWIQQMADALAYAHRSAEVVHRDLKPANLMVDARGELKVADFGIAASVSDSVSRVSVQAGSSGTPVYMSPQQMMGEQPAVADDIYAFGATVYELLTGRPPFYSGNVMMQVMNKVPPSMAIRRKELDGTGKLIPENWETTVAACLAKDPKDRPKDMLALKREFAGALDSTVGSDVPKNRTGFFEGPTVSNDIFGQIFGDLDKEGEGNVEMSIRLAPDDMANGGRFEVPIQRDGKTVTVQVDIPAAVEVGTRIRMKGMGDAKNDGQGLGDLFLKLEEPEVAPKTPPKLPAKPTKQKKKRLSFMGLLFRVVMVIGILLVLIVGGFWLVIELDEKKRLEARIAREAVLELKLSDRVLEVPSEFSTLSYAIDAADVGMTVELSAGIYTDPIHLSKNINLRGSPVPGETVVAVPPTRNALLMTGSANGTISQITFKHTEKTDSESRSSLVSMDGISARFVNNRLEDAGGFALVLKNGGESVIEDNQISTAAWGGILIHDKGVGEFRNNSIHHNDGQGIEVRDTGPGVLIFGNSIFQNGSNGIWLKSPEPLRIISNTLNNNGRITANTGGIGISKDARPTLVANISENNNGAGIWWQAGSVPVIGADNVSDGEPLDPKN